jgi:hypothetical protein
MQFKVEQRHHEVGGLGTGEPLLHDPHVIPELALGPALLHRRGLGQASPRRGIVRQQGAQVRDDRGVDVQAADVVAAIHRHDLEALGSPGDHTSVERARAEVVHDHDRADRYVPSEHFGEVGGGGDRLGDQPCTGQAGPLSSVGEQAAAGGTPGRRAGQRHVRGHRADRAAPFLGDALKHGGNQLHDRYLAVGQQDQAVVDAALRVGFEAGRVEAGAVYGVAPGDELAVRLRVHSRGQQR